jgi:hypothetical protein
MLHKDSSVRARAAVRIGIAKERAKGNKPINSRMWTRDDLTLRQSHKLLIISRASEAKPVLLNPDHHNRFWFPRSYTDSSFFFFEKLLH